MGKTADLAMDQKKIIDTLHKEGKSQRVITERGDCSQSAVSKHIKCKVDWKEEIGLENVHINREWFKLHREWNEAGISASRVTTLQHLQEKGY